MPHNLLVTGPPRSGKTTVIQAVRTRLGERGRRVGGIVSPEIRVDGGRVGFEVVDLLTGASRVLAHVDRDAGPAVGKYRVAVGNVDAIAASAIQQALAEADVLLIDEIAPMEVRSETFIRQVTRALDADLPVLASIHYRSTTGFIAAVKARDDVELFEVREETREELPSTLVGKVLGWL